MRKRQLQSEDVVCGGRMSLRQKIAGLRLTLDVSEINADFRVVASDQAIASHQSLTDTRYDLWFGRQYAGHGRDEPSRSRHAAEIKIGAAKARLDAARLASPGLEEADETEKGTPHAPQLQTKGQPGKRELCFRRPDRGDISEEQLLFVRERI